MRNHCLSVALGFILISATSAATKPAPTAGDRMIAAYFEEETSRIEKACLADVQTLDQWKACRPGLRRQLLDMLGLDPMPAPTELKPVVTGRIERDGIVVEKLCFQSRPRLYVTGNLYLPKEVKRPIPAILYVCGHGQVKIGGVSYGNKVAYQYQGAWFAAHGYACLAIDSLQLGEIEGIHHGTYREGLWWWINRGYTPAGVEAWNCIRAIDYLQSRGEIDPQRIGVTGRSGGGAYSWWIAAIDDRIKAAVPVAGITDLRNHVVDGCIEGHCDCMFMTNTYRWDYPAVAALVAPRPLMIGNSDRDGIFPLDGVVRTYNHVRRIYELFKAGDDLGLNIVPGPHKDNQDLQVPAIRWFNKYLCKDTETLIRDAAEKHFTPQELKVFKELPKDQLNSTIHETFIPAAAAPKVPDTREAWIALRDDWLKRLREMTFRAWPERPEPTAVHEAYAVEHAGLRLTACDFTSQGSIRLRMYVVTQAGSEKITRAAIQVVDQPQWLRLMAALPPAADRELAADVRPKADIEALAELQREVAAERAVVYVPPRGVGPSAWNPSPQKQTHIKRRFLLLGQTLDGMQVWDVRRAIAAVASYERTRGAAITLAGRGVMAGVALYAAMFEPDVGELVLDRLPATHRNGPILLNVSRTLEMPQAVAIVAEHARVRLLDAAPADWEYPSRVAPRLGWKTDQLQVASGK